MKVSVLLSGGTGVGLNFLPHIPCITGPCPFFLANGPITLPFEAVHTYMASKREFNPWGFLHLDLFQLQNITRKQEPIKWSLHFPYKPLESTLSEQIYNQNGSQGRLRAPAVGSANHIDEMTLLLYSIKQQEIRCCQTKHNHKLVKRDFSVFISFKL